MVVALFPEWTGASLAHLFHFAFCSLVCWKSFRANRIGEECAEVLDIHHFKVVPDLSSLLPILICCLALQINWFRYELTRCRPRVYVSSCHMLISLGRIS